MSFDDLAAAADIISIHCPLFPSTHHLINKEAIDKMKRLPPIKKKKKKKKKKSSFLPLYFLCRGVMILNTSRGAIIDTEALLEVLFLFFFLFFLFFFYLFVHFRGLTLVKSALLVLMSTKMKDHISSRTAATV